MLDPTEAEEKERDDNSSGMAPRQDIEKAIITKYRKRLWSKFTRAIRDFRLIESGDRIAVAISGGKDSTLMAKLFQELYAHGHRNFQLQFIAMDPGYSSLNRQSLVRNCEQLDIPVEVFDSEIFGIVEQIAADYPCYMCARMRRGALYARAQAIGCNKLALGHHFNDAIETTLLNVFYAGTFKTMLPKLRATNFPGLELIRPLYYVEEQVIEKFTCEYGIQALNCACRVAANKTGNQRYAIKALIAELKTKFPHVDQMIMRSTRNVNLDCILGWQQGGEKYSFLDHIPELDHEI